MFRDRRKHRAISFRRFKGGSKKKGKLELSWTSRDAIPVEFKHVQQKPSF